VEVPRGDSLHWCHSRGVSQRIFSLQGGILKKKFTGGIPKPTYFAGGYQLFNPIFNNMTCYLHILDCNQFISKYQKVVSHNDQINLVRDQRFRAQRYLLVL
jgi:hypothetical protein